MQGQFVRALGTVYHLDCFRCQDCNKVVAAKFFPIDGPEGKQYPLCETDYFRRLNLLCAKCGGALRGSYITALADMKFHVEHFTCSICPTVFGPQDSYYEHDGAVYCHFHYSTRFAVQCTGCKTAILKQFVEINRNSVDEHWHPECYMIHKFWNIKLHPPSPSTPSTPAIKERGETKDEGSVSESTMDGSLASLVTAETSQSIGPEVPGYILQEERETPQSLREKQKQMEEQVYRIWTVLSTFEESSAACISEMLRRVSNGHYLDGVGMAEKFVLHVETLFSTLDDIGVQFRAVNAKGKSLFAHPFKISHVREARMLCKKIVNFFSLLSHTQETGARKMAITQELLSLVTGLAHYLKILIRIGLTSALKLDRDYGNKNAMVQFLGKLERLVRDPDVLKTSIGQPNGQRAVAENGKQVRPYGYKSLSRAVGTLVGQGEATTDLCERCKITVEEECARFGTSLRWHFSCLRCATCGKVAHKDKEPPSPSEGQAPFVYVRTFFIEFVTPEPKEGRPPQKGPPKPKPGRTFCSNCAMEGLRSGFEAVTRLEQFAFLLCVALNKLYALLKQKGVVPASPTSPNFEPSQHPPEEVSLYDSYRDSTDIKRMKSVHLDRKISATAKLPKRSTVVESPSGRTAQTNAPGTAAPESRQYPTPGGDPPAALRPTPSDRQLSNQPRNAHLVPDNQGQPRPTFSRSTTAVRVIDDQGLDQPPIQVQQPPREPAIPEPGHAAEAAITLADLTEVMQAEQARAQRRSARPQGGFILLSELPALEYFIVKHIAALALSQEQVLRDETNLDELLDVIEARKNNFWNKLFKGGNEKRGAANKKKGVFGVPLEALVERNGVDSMHGAGPAPVRVPSFVDDCISAMKQMDMSVEGIFRKNGNIKRLRELSEALDKDLNVSLSEDNPVQLAALLKKFLREMPDPLIPFKLYHLFIATQRVPDEMERRRLLHLTCCLMPKVNRDTMEVVFVFLKWVASFSHVDEETGSKMDLQNLATVVCPNILYSGNKDPSKDESFLAIRATHELLEFQDEFWLVPEEFEPILKDPDLLSNPSELATKDILRRCENHYRTRDRAPRAHFTGPRQKQHGSYDSQPHRPEIHHGISATGMHGELPRSPPMSPPMHERPLSWNANTPRMQPQQSMHVMQQNNHSHHPSQGGDGRRDPNGPSSPRLIDQRGNGYATPSR
ncbi:RhoGAP-domain-containing protein [Atractiella rhizophila]|nr:RhoGAP-domain-containing protein [Atractiella rhizophila]